MVDLDYRWGWAKNKRKVTLSKEAVRDIVLNCKKGEEEKYAKKYKISVGYTGEIRTGRCRKKEYRDIKGIEQGDLI